jgi:hypothetical protein
MVVVVSIEANRVSKKDGKEVRLLCLLHCKYSMVSAQIELFWRDWHSQVLIGKVISVLEDGGQRRHELVEVALRRQPGVQCRVHDTASLHGSVAVMTAVVPVCRLDVLHSVRVVDCPDDSNSDAHHDERSGAARRKGRQAPLERPKTRPRFSPRDCGRIIGGLVC